METIDRKHHVGVGHSGGGVVMGVSEAKPARVEVVGKETKTGIAGHGLDMERRLVD
jgi:hypothetical protein